MYVALHNHSDYSFLDSTCRIADLVQAASGYGMPALALTDRENLCGVVEFVHECRKADIRPLIGCELTMYGGGHLTVLCKSVEGYVNLSRLLTRTQKTNRHIIHRAQLKQHTSGLIGLSGCRHGEIARLLAEGHDAEAARLARTYASMFADGFYIELFHHQPADMMLSRNLARLARATGLSTVATPNTHYLRPGDSRRFLVLSSIRTLTLLDEPHHQKKQRGQYHFRSPSEMHDIFRDFPDACANTLRIADACRWFEECDWCAWV